MVNELLLPGLLKEAAVLIVAAFIIGAVAMGLLLPVLIRMKTGQNIREEGPQSHLAKAGTPSMGGISIIIATIVTALTMEYLIIGRISTPTLLIHGGFLAFGLLGFWDDFMKILKKQNLGLRAWQKMVFQIGLSLLVAICVTIYMPRGGYIYIPFVNDAVNIGLWRIPFIVFVIVAMTNAVNLTDGLDGLAGGVTSIVGFVFGMFCLLGKFHDSSVFFFLALCGACLGFLIFNHHPAKVFMGDTGSLALGGGLAIAAVVAHCELILPILGLIYVAEALSVVIQVASFKTTGKRVFRMAPIHHHFELGGMKETSVVMMFYIITAICGVITFYFA